MSPNDMTATTKLPTTSQRDAQISPNDVEVGSTDSAWRLAMCQAEKATT